MRDPVLQALYSFIMVFFDLRADRGGVGRDGCMGTSRDGQRGSARYSSAQKGPSVQLMGISHSRSIALLLMSSVGLGGAKACKIRKNPSLWSRLRRLAGESKSVTEPRPQGAVRLAEFCKSLENGTSDRSGLPS